MFSAWLAVTGLAVAPPPPAPFSLQDVEESSLLIHGARVIVRPGVELADADVLIQRGVVVAVGEGLAAPEGAREITGAVVCAGFLDPWAVLGLDGGSATDQSVTAASRTVDALDHWSEADHLGDALEAGVTASRVQAGVRSLMSGIGAVVRNDPSLLADGAVVLEDACVGASIGLVRGGRARDIFDRVGEVGRLVGQIESGRKYRESQVEYKYDLEEWQKEIAEKEKELEKDFKKAKKSRDKDKKEAEEKDKEFKEKKYKEDKKPRKPKFDENKEVMARVAHGEVPLVVEIHRSEEIRSLLEKTEQFDRLRLILSGGTEALHHAEALAERKIPVIVWPAPMGSRRSDEYDGHDLSLASQLHEAGVTVLIGSGGTDTSRDLRLLASLAVGHGLDPEAAFDAITLTVARAFDVGDRLGSLERGKDADVLVLDGDPLDTTTRVQYVISNGQVVVEP